MYGSRAFRFSGLESEFLLEGVDGVELFPAEEFDFAFNLLTVTEQFDLFGVRAVTEVTV